MNGGEEKRTKEDRLSQLIDTPTYGKDLDFILILWQATGRFYVGE